MNRRKFLKVSGAAAIGSAAALSSGLHAKQKKSKLPAIGLQLYSLRGLMKEDFSGTLEKVAKIGYTELEFAGYFDNDPKDVKALLGKLGMSAPATHVSIDRLRNNLPKEIEDAKTVGHQYIVCPWLAQELRTEDGYKALAESLNKAGEACKKAGIQLAYHNHEFEFEKVGEMIPYDYLLAQTDADLVKMELDFYWINVAKSDPLAYFKKHAGRFPLCHVKDMGEDGKMVDVGKGTIDFANYFSHSEQAGMKHYFVEHDNPEDPIATITDSYQHLNQMKF